MKVIYILGQGHSGSTVLSKIIGSNINIRSLGEVRHWSNALSKKHLFIKEADYRCSCGQALDKCNFFSKITNNYRTKYNLNAYLNKKGKLDLILFILGLKKVNAIKINNDDYIKFLKDIKSQISEKYIIDSSKTIGNLIKLKNTEEIDLFVIHLIRDVRGVGNSYDKIKNYNFYIEVINWIIFNYLYRKFLKNSKLNYISVSYDMFAQFPDTYLSKIGNTLNLDFSDYKENIIKTEYHEIAGNEKYAKKLYDIKYDQTWQIELPLFKKMFASLIGFFFNRRWVYNKI